MIDFSDEEFEEILNIFQCEGDEITSRLNDTLIQLEKNPSSSETINTLFRNTHSLKGASRMVGFNNIQKLAHSIEDVLGLARDKKLHITKFVIDILIETVDYIKNLINLSVKQKSEVYDDNYNKYLQKLISIKEGNDITFDEQSNDVSENKDNVINIISSENWQKIFTIISDTNNFISELKIYNNGCVIENVINYFQKVKIIFEKVNFDNEVLIFNHIIEKLKFINNASNVISKNDADYILTQFAKIEKNVRQKAINDGINIVSDYNHEDIPEEVRKNILRDDVVNVLGQKVDNLHINSKLSDDLMNIIVKFNSLTNLNSKEKVYTKIDEILDNIKNDNSFIKEDVVAYIKNTLLAVSTSDENLEDVNLIINQLSIIEQLYDNNHPENNLIKTDDPVNINKNSYQKLDDIIISNEQNEIKTMRVDTVKLDKLVNQVGELITNKIKTRSHLQSLNEIQDDFEFWHNFSHKSLNYIKYFERKLNHSINVRDVDSMLTFMRQFFMVFKDNSDRIHDLIYKLSKLHRKIQDDDSKMSQTIMEIENMVKNIRVLPMSIVFQALPRMVRDISKQSGKEVELFIMGSNVTADKKIIEEIKTPLIHILRNSIDHGIELPEIREKNLKPRVGKIYISARHINNKLVIEIQDDGCGVNIDKIKEKVLKQGLLTADEINSMPDEQIMNIIFWPGFSTTDIITDISGRGIGLDVVQTKINKLNGKVNMTSVLSKGAKVKIELPTSMATVKVFVFSVGGQYFAIPTNVINLVKFINNDAIIEKEKYKYVIIDNEGIPVFRFSEIFDIKPQIQTSSCFKTNENTKETMIVIESDNIKIGFIADKIIGDQEVLHNKLNPPLIKHNLISGITTLISGDLCLILNASGLVNIMYNRNENVLNLVDATKYLKITEQQKSMLIVDDSISIIAYFKNIFKDTNLKIDTSYNVSEALNNLNKNNYDLVITDIEMPKLTGFDLIQKMKSDKNLSSIPIVVVTGVDLNEEFYKKIGNNAKFVMHKGNLNKDEFRLKIFDILNNNDKKMAQ